MADEVNVFTIDDNDNNTVDCSYYTGQCCYNHNYGHVMKLKHCMWFYCILQRDRVFGENSTKKVVLLASRQNWRQAIKEKIEDKLQ